MQALDSFIVKKNVGVEIITGMRCFTRFLKDLSKVRFFSVYTYTAQNKKIYIFFSY